MSNLMFAPMSQRLAEAGERDRKERAERLDAERIEREAQQAREKSREQEDAEFAQKMVVTSDEAVAKQQAIVQANLDAIARQKQEREAEILLFGKAVGDRVAERIAPVLTEIADALKQLKDGKPKEK
jgi:hypothetical protein